MKRRALRRFVYCCLALAFLMPVSANAGVYRVDEKATNIDGVVEDDLYIGTDTLRIRGTVNGDVSAAGRRIQVPGTIAGAANLAGEVLSIDGTVERAARLAGRDIEIEGKVGRDVIAFAQSLDTGRASVMGRDVVAFAQDMKIEGKVAGSIRAGAATLLINAEVAGDVDVAGAQVELGPEARIAGDLTYESDEPLSRDENAVVGGKVSRRSPGEAARPGPGEIIAGQLRSMIGPLVMGLILLWLVPPVVPGIAATVRARSSSVLLAGVGMLLLVPVLGVLLFFIFTVLGGGWSVPLTLMGLYSAALFMARVMAGYALGTFILERTKNSSENPSFGQRFAALALGVVVLTVLEAIPVIGAAVLFLSALFSLGGAVVFFNSWRDRIKSPPAPLDLPPAPPEAPAAA